MRRNLIKKRLLAGETVIGTMVQEVMTPAIAQVFKQVGFDFFMIDLEHGPYSLRDAADIMRVGRILDMCPMVRIASCQYQFVSQNLDHGAMGLMLPRVSLRDDVETFVRYMKYPPIGERGCSSDAPHAEYDFGPLTEFLEINNRDTLAIAQIERADAIDNIDDILSVEGVDVALIGPEDLSVSLGIPGESTDHPKMEAAFEKVIDSAHRHQVVTGLHMGNMKHLKKWMARGMRMIMYSSDLSFIMDASAAGLSELRNAVVTKP